MEGLARKEQLGFKGQGPIGVDKFEITIFVGAVDLVADDRVPDMCEMDANLVGSACFWLGFDEGERTLVEGETVQDAKRGKGREAVGMDRLFQPDL